MSVSRNPLDPGNWQGPGRTYIILVGLAALIGLGYLISGLIGVISR